MWIFGDLQDIAIFRKASALDFFFQSLQNILIVFKAIHIVVRKSELGL
jgi:hypothetical protein